MFSSEKVRSISSTLPSLTLSDLQLLKEEIESIIKANNVKDIEFELTTSFKTSESISNKIVEEALALQGVELSNTPSLTVSTGTLDNTTKSAESVQKPSRPLGIWKGQIEISEDFYKTSSDILSDFGIQE
ncbi:hypothetical protein I8752_27235 [Nostocaceae cyanobacterium CENA369]|uniref:Uncharacterized protein n=1 Tax=Dendronalium phyllosphericum CENA369 TaxID=1725256 RepID=A0A8J7I607_9NOST|nr:hypothetical protein [Dendronalium phyllosphericum]MBH8576616.1 hypothetical protein [Dendronalium phyllosphericum CENA369]